MKFSKKQIDKLKRLSEEISCPIITAMQMNRSGENFNRKGAAVLPLRAQGPLDADERGQRRGAPAAARDE